MTNFSPPFAADMTLIAAQDELRKLVWDGSNCPCCTQFAKVYRRKIHARMAATLITMYRRAGLAWLYLPDVPQKSRDSTGLAHWGLIEEDRNPRDDGGRAGWWRVTLTGEEWVLAATTVHKYAYIFDGRCLKHDGEGVGIRDALGTKFNYDELMQGV